MILRDGGVGWDASGKCAYVPRTCSGWVGGVLVTSHYPASPEEDRGVACLEVGVRRHEGEECKGLVGGWGRGLGFDFLSAKGITDWIPLLCLFKAKAHCVEDISNHLYCLLGGNLARQPDISDFES